MPLTNIKIKNAKPQSKPYKLYDEKGVFLLVHTNGSKYWRFKYRYAGKEKLYSIGIYPQVNLKDARHQRDIIKNQLAEGIDPSQFKKAKKNASRISSDNSFGSISNNWLKIKRHEWSEGYAKKLEGRLKKNLLPILGTRPIKEISPPELLGVLKIIESRGAIETTHRCNSIASDIFQYAIACGLAERDPSQDIKKALMKPVVKHRASITNVNLIGPLLRRLDSYQGSPQVCAALKLAPLTFVRPGELRQAKWSDINFDTSEWRFYVSKTEVNHIVPLSKQALDILSQLKNITHYSEYVFPNARSPKRAMSDNAVLSALRNLDIPKEEMCGHGFRAMARTVMDEILNIRTDWIEHQLAHAVRDVHGRAYNRTAHLDGRKEMMQAWADYLDELKLGL